MSSCTNHYYLCGKNARKSGRGNSPPVHLDTKNRHWWMAGWNDADRWIITKHGFRRNAQG